MKKSTGHLDLALAVLEMAIHDYRHLKRRGMITSENKAVNPWPPSRGRGGKHVLITYHTSAQVDQLIYSLRKGYMSDMMGLCGCIMGPEELERRICG